MFLFRWMVSLILCVTAVTGCYAQVGFVVSPAKIYFNAKGAGEQTARLHLNNSSNTRLVLQAECADWRRDSTGTKVYSAAGSLPTSCCALVQVSPSIIELEAGEERDVLVTMRPGAAALSGGLHNGMLMLTQTNEHEAARLRGGSQFIIKTQIGVHVYVLPEEAGPPAIAITGMQVARAGEDYSVNVKVHNTGGTLLESIVRLEYTNLETMEEVKAEPVPVNTMPKDAFSVVAAVPKQLPPGKYLIVAMLDSGPGHALKVAELETVLK